MPHVWNTMPTQVLKFAKLHLTPGAMTMLNLFAVN